MKNYIITLLILLTTNCHIEESSKSKKENLPNFKILLSDSITYYQPTDIATNKPIILFYFGPYCDHSRTVMERIIKNMDYFKDINLVLVTPEPYIDMKSFYNHFHLNEYPKIKVGIDYNHFFRTHFKITSYPFLLIYDKNKKLIETFNGEVYARQIRNSLEKS